MNRRNRTIAALVLVGSVGLGLGYSAAHGAGGGFTATAGAPRISGPFVTATGTVTEVTPRTTRRAIFEVALYRKLPGQTRGVRMVRFPGSVGYRATRATGSVFAACRRHPGATWTTGVGWRVLDRQGRVVGSGLVYSAPVRLPCR